MTLDAACRGERLVVESVRDEAARVHAIRFGMCAGAELTCLTRIPGGPVVVMCGRQEIAVGRKLARCIHVSRCAARAGEVT
ncbi:MAG: ferrous iron transport protein A [Coriobacteriia bacterium]|nr:ferrous iron transport protein A [Coriobacteriia bacterium]